MFILYIYIYNMLLNQDFFMTLIKTSFHFECNK